MAVQNGNTRPRNESNMQDWPEWFTEFRPHQTTAIDQIVSLFHSGAKIVQLDAPTGAGKTLIGEGVRRELKTNAAYICSDRSLQDQFATDFDYAKVLKGRSNYPTENMPWPEYSAADCAMTKDPTGCQLCPHRDDCQYNQAKKAALSGEIAVLNTSFFLNEANHVGGFGGRGLVIADESDLLESALMGFVEFAAGDGLLRELKLQAPKKGSHKTTIANWLTDVLSPALATQVEQLADLATGDRADVDVIRRLQRYRRMRARIPRIAADVTGDEWVRDNDAGPLTLKPIHVAKYARRNLWRHGERWLLMSATVISPDEQAESLGMNEMLGDDGEVVHEPLPWDYVTVGMTFPVENRPVNVVPVASMARKDEETSKPKLVTAITRVLEQHPDANTLIHTHSYRLTEHLFKELKRAGHKVDTYFKGNERDAALDRFVAHGGILLAPSLGRGIDLPDDLCRVQIVAKVPFPYLGDPQISQRMRMPGGQTWYRVQTVRTIVQMTGRAVRHKDDWAHTYILDKEFVRLYRDSMHLFPKWWREAVEIQGVYRYIE